MPPLAAGAHDVEQAVEQAPHVRRARPTARLGGRNERLQQPKLLVVQRLPGAEVSDQRAIFGRPHADLRVGEAPGSPSPQPPSRRQANQRTLSKRAVSGGRLRCLSIRSTRFFDLLVVNLFNVMENPNKLVIGLLLFGMECFHLELKGLLSCL